MSDELKLSRFDARRNASNRNIFHIGYRSITRLKEDGKANYDKRPEDQLTDFFAFMLRVDEAFRNAWYESIFGEEPEGDFEVDTQIHFGSKHPDMLLRYGSRLFLCENKLGNHAKLGRNQLDNYPTIVRGQRAAGEDWYLMVLSDVLPNGLSEWTSQPEDFFLMPKDGSGFFRWQGVHEILAALGPGEDATLAALRADFLEHLDEIGVAPLHFVEGGTRDKLVSADVEAAKAAWREQIHLPFREAASAELARFGLGTSAEMKGGGASPQLWLKPLADGAFAKTGGTNIRVLPSPPSRGAGLAEIHLSYAEESQAKRITKLVNASILPSGIGLDAETVEAKKFWKSVVTLHLREMIGEDDLDQASKTGSPADIYRERLLEILTLVIEG